MSPGGVFAFVITTCLIVDVGLVVLLVKAFERLAEHLSAATILAMLGVVVIAVRLVSVYRRAGDLLCEARLRRLEYENRRL